MLNQDGNQTGNMKFTIHGKEAEDNTLYPWALGSIGKALLFYSEANNLKSNKIVAGIAAYYSLFHLSMFLYYSYPDLLTYKQRTKINNALKEGVCDPSPEVHHKEVIQFLKKCSTNGLPIGFSDAVEKANELRNFLNYGPRISYTSTFDINVNSCQYSPIHVDELIDNLQILFEMALYWGVTNCRIDGGTWMRIALGQAEEFFQNNKFYNKFAIEDILDDANKFRIHLEEYLRKKEGSGGQVQKGQVLT